MKLRKKQQNFRLSLEIRATLYVLQELTGDTMTHILEDCIRPGKKTFARSRNIDYQDLLFRIQNKQNELRYGHGNLEKSPSHEHKKGVDQD